jgi:hypothetical protein
MRGRALAVVLLMSVAACSHEPPVYESTYTSPPSTPVVSTPAAAPIEASFVDTFDRPDGELGEGWDLRTYIDSFPMPPASDGFIRGGAYTYAGNQVVYAARQFPGTVRRMGTIGRWRQIRGAGEETGIAMAISPNDQLITHMVHFAATRSVWNLTVRRGAGFEPVAEGKFTPTLELGRDYEFEISATDTAVTVRVPGDEVTTDVPVADLLGDRAFWEEYAKPTPASTTFDFDTVWADVP